MGDKDREVPDKEKVENYLNDFFEKEGYYNACGKYGFRPEVGEMEFKNNHYLVEITTEYKDIPIILEKIIVDDKLNRDIRDNLSTGYLITKYHAGIKEIEEAIDYAGNQRKEVINNLYELLNQHEFKKEDVEEFMMDCCELIFSLPKSLECYVDTYISGIELISEMGLLYTDELDEKYIKISNQITSILRDMTKSNNMHDAMNYLYANEENYGQELKIKMHYPILPGLIENIELKAELGDLTDFLLIENLKMINERIEDKKYELEELVNSLSDI